MEVSLSRLAVRLAPRARRKVAFGLINPCINDQATARSTITRNQRPFITTTIHRATEKPPKRDPNISDNKPDSSHAQPAVNLSHNVSDEETNHYQRMEKESKEKQRVSPWMREGSDKPPAAPESNDMTKGKLLTTPSRMLKFIIPLTRSEDKNSKVEPLALLVHPQQPLSYLERLIQSELPVLEDNKAPKVVFRAEDTGDDAKDSEKKNEQEDDDDEIDIDEQSAQHKTKIDGKLMRTGKLNASGQVEEPGPKSASDELPDDPKHPNFVRWSPSTETGDFIRDAARGKEFALDIESLGTIYIGVPSFEDRTYYLRMRLRKTSQKILHLADVKSDCDKLARRGAKRVAQTGFAGLISWWAAVYYLTFRTELGWEVMEPVTYLVGLSGLIGGYMWFLYHNREVSYQSAMNFTVSRRQSQLYEQKGFDVQKWEFLVDEGNRLRREIKLVADEYDAEWDETKDEGHKKVVKALREERKKEKNKDDKDGDDDKDDGDDSKTDGKN